MRTEEERFYIGYMNLRMAVGWTGLLMPIVVRACGYLFQGIWSPTTISAYYYTGMRDVFVGTLILVGVLLMCYRTPANEDRWLGFAAGLSAIGIGLFPMEETYAEELTSRYPEHCFSGCFVPRGILGFHGYFVGAFFVLALYMMWFRFSAFTPATPSREKIRRNMIYKVCAVGMALAGLFMWISVTKNWSIGIFWSESFAVMWFALAWLVKGQLILKDKIREE